MRPVRLHIRSIRTIAAVSSGLGLAACLGGCSSHTTERASLEYRALVIEPTTTGFASTRGTTVRLGSPRTLSSVPTD